MKQIQNGTRVANWHRPFRKHQFSQRYLRLAEAPLLEDLDTNNASAHHDDRCDCLRCDQDDHRDNVTKPDIARQEISNRLFGNRQLPLQSLISPEQRSQLLAQCPAESPALPELLPTRFSPSELPLELAKFATYFDRGYQTQHPLPDSLRDFLEDDAALQLVREVHTDLLPSSPETLVDFVLLRPFWVRDLHTWKDPQNGLQNRMRSLIDHLFVIYPVPEFLYQGWNPRPREARAAWLHERLNPNSTWIQWFLLLAQGSSLQQAAPLFGWEISRKFTHHLFQVPSNLNFADGCLWVTMQQLGINQLAFETIRDRYCFDFKPTQDHWKREHQEFCRQALAWLDRHWECYARGEKESVLDFAVHQITESERRGAAPFRWQGRSAAGVLALSRAYEESRYLPYIHNSWARKGWDMQITDQYGDVYEFKELCNGKEVYLEGIAMRHCVGSYAFACARGQCAIFSMLCNGKRKVTIEITMATKTVAQAKGTCNRQASSEERALIRQWLAAKVLR